MKFERALIRFMPAIGILLVVSAMLACSGPNLPATERVLADKLDAKVELDIVEIGITTATVTDPALSEIVTATPTRPNPDPSNTISPLPTATITPPNVSITSTDQVPPPTSPELFLPEAMKPGVSPATYVSDTCEYLENRWGSHKSHPGTVVVPIMFHSVVQPGRLINDSTSISMEDFEYFMATAKEMGFSTITTEELAGFLEHNQAIPQRSMILILDDRRPGVTELFMPYLEENDWTLTLGWIASDSTRDAVWETMTELASTGRLDVQSHGFNHIYVQDYLEVEQIEEEVFKPIEVIEARFGTTPLAHVWPGGNFNEIAIELAKEAGYKIGFTAYSRGPILFNWVPLGEPEMEMGEPLMLLPRFWSTAAVGALEEAVMVSESAQAHAKEARAAELAYYLYYCQPYGND